MPELERLSLYLMFPRKNLIWGRLACGLRINGDTWCAKEWSQR